jgi:hypothetical protein
VQRALFLPEHLLLLFFLQADHLQLLNDNILLYLFLFRPLGIVGGIGLRPNVVLQFLNFVVDISEILDYLTLIQTVVY